MLRLNIGEARFFRRKGCKMRRFREKFIGDKQFYKMILMVALPIMIQNGITNFVGLLDNVMVGQLGTEQMSGVAIVNQLVFVFNLCIFGAVAGAGILGAQFYGSGNHEGVRNALRFKLISAGVLTIVCAAILVLFNEPLINAFLHEGGSEQRGQLQGRRAEVHQLCDAPVHR